MIYNSFALSVGEQIKYLGMLSSVGATRKQKKKTLYFEGAILGGIGIILGIALGLLTTFISQSAMNGQNCLDYGWGITTISNIQLIFPCGCFALLLFWRLLTVFVFNHFARAKGGKNYCD